MSGGFGSVVSFIFVFLITSSLIVTSFVFIIEDTSNKLEVLQANKESLEEAEIEFDLASAYSASGKLTVVVNNSGSEILKFRENGGGECFSFFINDEFVSTDDYYMNINGGAAAVDYDLIEAESLGYVIFTGDYNYSEDIIIKAVSCEGKTSVFTIQGGGTGSSGVDWWDEDWQYRKNVNINHTYNESVTEYQVPIDLNSSNFDFDLADRDELRVIMPFYEMFKLDLTFDTVSQRLTDHSDYNNNVTLGTTVASEASDPNQANGVLLNGLHFDGVDDYLTVLGNSSLAIDNVITISSWIKWNQSGDTLQYIVKNGDNVSLSIVNDGGANDDQLRFNLTLDNVITILHSNITIDNKWRHVAATYNSDRMRLYIDSVLVGDLKVNGSMGNNRTIDNYVGSNNLTSYFNGTMDELKIMNYALEPSEVTRLYTNSLDFKELDFHVATFDRSLQMSRIFAKMPSLGINETRDIQVYYGNEKSVNSTSDLNATFSYVYPRLIGYIGHDRISDTIGLSIINFYDDNHLIVGANTNDLEAGDRINNLDETLLNFNDPIYSKHLVHLEGNGGGVNSIASMTFMGTEFAHGRMTSNPDRFCITSPFGDAFVMIFDVGVNVLNLTPGPAGLCDASLNLGNSDNTYINSTLPVLVHYSGAGTGANDPYTLHPMIAGNWLMVTTNRLDISAGPDGASALWYSSNGNDGAFNLNGFVDGAVTGQGNDGTAPAIIVKAQNPVGILKDSDGDGADMVHFTPEYLMATQFGSNEPMDYVVAASPYSDANCSTYDVNDVLIDNKPTGQGQNGIYNYSFGNLGVDVQNLTAGWTLRCDKPVNPVMEDTGNDNINMMGHVHMRQFVHPEPQLTIS